MEMSCICCVQHGSQQPHVTFGRLNCGNLRLMNRIQNFILLNLNFSSHVWLWLLYRTTQIQTKGFSLTTQGCGHCLTLDDSGHHDWATGRDGSRKAECSLFRCKGQDRRCHLRENKSQADSGSCQDFLILFFCVINICGQGVQNRDWQTFSVKGPFMGHTVCAATNSAGVKLKN